MMDAPRDTFSWLNLPASENVQQSFLRFELPDLQTKFGVVDPQGIISVCSGDMFGDFHVADERHHLNEVRVLAPNMPSKIIAAWHNSKALLSSLGRERPATLRYVIKPPSSVIGQGDNIALPSDYGGRTILEGEIGVVIGRKIKNAGVREATECIFGYTIVNDVTAIDMIREDEVFFQFTRAKGFDTFCPIGPVIRVGLQRRDLSSITVKSYLNGVLCQCYALSDLAFDPIEAVVEASKVMTLVPGDVISCGTSNELNSIKSGDVVEIEISEIGRLKNRVQ